MAGLIVPLGGEEEKKKPAQNLMADPQARAAQERFDKAKEVFSRYGSPMEAYTDPVAEADSQRAGINLLNGTEKAPADVARAMQIARRYGVPTEAIVPNQSEYARRLQTEDNVNTLTAAPRTRGWLADNPDAAALAQNDIDHMSRTEMALDYMWASTKAGTNALLASGAKLLETVLPGTSDEELAVLFKDRPEELKRMREESAAMFLSRFARERMAASEANMKAVSPDTQREYGTLQYATTQTEQAAYLSPVKVVSDALRSLPTTAAMAVTAYLTRGQSLRAEQAALASGASAEVAKQAGIKAAQETFAKIGAASEGAVGFAQQAVDTQGKVEGLSQAKLEQSPLYQQMIAQGFDPYAARVLVAARTGQESGIGAGAVDAVTNLLGGKILGKVIGEGGSLLPRVGKGASTEAVTEFVQSAGEQVAENISMQANVNPDQSLGQDVLESALAGFFVGGLTGGVVAGVLGRDQQVRAAEDAHTALQEIDQAVAAAESRALDPETFRQFAESVEGAGDAVYIDGQTLLQSGRVEELVKAVPEIADQLEAAQLGTMVRIPMADYLTNVAGTELNQAIMPELRVDPNGMTFKESQEYNDKYAETLQQEVAAAVERKIADDAVRESAKRVEDRVFQELQSSGRWSDTVNRAYATLWKHRAVSMASRLNMTPEDFFNQRVLKVRSESMGGQQLDQPIATVDAGDVAVTDQVDEATGLPLNADGTVTLYHHTSAANAAAIKRTQTLKSAGEPSVYLTTRETPDTGYGDTVVKVRIDPAKLQLDDEFPDGRRDFSVDVGRPGGALRGAAFNQSLPTMVPSTVGAQVDLNEATVPGFEEAEMAGGEKALEINVGLFEKKQHQVGEKTKRGYDSIAPLEGTPSEKAEQIISQMVRNLLSIFDAIPEAIRNRSRHWYDGANRISLVFGERYGVTPMQSAGVLAVLSPQADWFMNVSYAERIFDILRNQQNYTWDDSMSAWADKFLKSKQRAIEKEAAQIAAEIKQLETDLRAQEKVIKRKQAMIDRALEKGDAAKVKEATNARNKEQTVARSIQKKLDNKRLRASLPNENVAVQESLRGKKLSELTNNFERAWWIRTYDEAHNPRSYRAVTPEGDFYDYVLTDKGNPEKIGWKSFDPISKAVSIILDGSVDNVHRMLGNEHKVRNFYNNIYAPNASTPFVTSDTHQVAANLFLPLGADAVEVENNFGSSGASSVGAQGLNGTYWLYSEAVRRAAGQRDVLPREMQSISWEAIRSLFSDVFKRDKAKVNQVRDLWKDYNEGKTTYEDTVNAIVQLAGGYDNPSWVEVGSDRAMAPEAGASSYESGLAPIELRDQQRRGFGPRDAGIPGGELPAGSGRAGGGVLNQSAQPTFYSQLERSIAQAKQTSAPASDWLAIIEKLPGVKKDEIEWSGIREYLQLRGKDKVTRDELVNYMRQNGVEIEETMLSNVNPDIYTKDITDQLESIETPHGDKASRVYNLSYIMPNTSILTNFTAYETEDGLVLFDYYGHYVDEFGSLDEIKEAINQDVSERLANSYVSPQYSTYVLPGGENYRELLLRLPYDPKQESYDSPHWSKVNVLAHIRFNERTDADGNRVLFIEEIQSDWAQEGRKKGFKSLDAKKQLIALNEEFENIDREIKSISARMQAVEGGSPEWQRLSEERQRLQDQQAANIDRGNALYDAQRASIPDAPFVKDTKAWVALAVKRMVRYAAENGFDKIAFVNGKQSADRYDLSKKIATLKVIKNMDGSFALRIKREASDRTFEMFKSRVVEDELSDVIGKELANRIVQDAASDKNFERDYSGLDLQVGGEGMINFYDKIVPQVVNDVLKKLGGGKLGITTINTADRYKQYQRAREESGMTDNEWARLRTSDIEKLIKPVFTEQLAFDITPEIRDTVMVGQALFQPARGSFNPETNTIALLKAADLSTFLHESGHFFLESQFAVAADLMQQSRMFGEDTNSPGEQSILDDTNAILRWFGINSLDEWFALDFEEKRAYHEKWAESFEAYLLEGKAPSIELQGVFNRFASWLKQVYKSIKDFLAANPAAGELTDEIRAVMDRMLATDEQIAIAQRTRSLMPLFATPEQAATLGVTIQDFQAYQQLGDDGKLEAEAQLQSRAVRDMKWLRNARSKRIRQMQREAKETRAEVRMVARREIMSQPVYQAWQFLTGKMTKEDKLVPPEVKRDKNRVQPSVDSLFEAIAKLGGLDFENVDTTWGWDERIPRPFFGKPLLRRDGKGKTIDEMAEALSELGYLAVDMHGKWDNAEFEDLFDDERRGKKHYSILVEPGAVDGLSGEYTPDMTNVGAGRLDYFDLRRMTIPDQYKQIIVDLKMTAKEGGYPVSAVAEKFGFASAEDMVRELGFAEDPDVAIEALTDAKMLEEYGDLSSPEAIEEAADKALHNDMLARMVTAEANALARAVGKIPVMERAAREAATALINRLAVRNVKPYQYAAAAARAGKAADKAFKGGDVGAAADEKRNQTFNVFATKAAYDALDEYNKAREFFRRVLRGKDDDVAKSRDMDLVQAARSILAGYGYGGKAKAAIDYVKTIREYDADLYDMLDDTFARLEANAKPLRELTIEEVRTLRDEIESLWNLAKRMRQSEVDGDLLDREDIADELNDRMTEIGVPDALGVDSALTPEQERSLEIKGALSFGKRVEFWVDYMDGLATKFGAFRRFIFTPIKEAADRYRADRARYVQQFRDALTTIAPTMKAEEIAAPELGYTFGKANGGVGLNEVLHAILHTGNESNKRKLLLGRGWATENADGSVNTSRWDAFLARMVREGKLTREHFDFAQTVWDILESMKPAAQKAHREAYGKYFAEVTADSFDVTFPDGTTATYRGGYVPAKVDPLLVKDNELKKLIEEGKESMAYSFPSPASGFTKSRTEYNKPLLLDLRSLAQHIDSVLLFSHMKIPARDVAKLLAMPAVSQPLNRLDPAAINSMLMPWLQRSATQRVSAPVLGGKLYGKIANALRARTSMATMFANVMNATQQVTGFMLAAVKVKPKYLAEAMGVYLRNPSGVAEQVSSLSTYMENRMFSEVQDMMNEIERITVNPSILESAQDWTTRHMFFLQTAVDNVMGPIIWMGAYNEALATAPADVMADQQELEKYAQRLADAAVRQTQGSTLPEDVSRLETGSVLLRPLQMFMGYFNMQANLLGSGLATIHRDMGLRRGAAIGAYVFMLAFYAPALVAEAIALAFRGGPEDDEKDGYLDDWLMQLFLWGPLRNATAMVPYAGQAINSGMARFNGNPMDDRMSVSPVISTIEAVAGVPYDLYKVAIGEPNVRQTIRDVGTATSVLLGVPGGAVARPAGYVGAMAQERVAPTGPADLVRGLVTGVPSAESRQ